MTTPAHLRRPLKLSDRVLVRRLVNAENEHASLYRKKKTTTAQRNRQWEVKRRLNAYRNEINRRGLIRDESEEVH